MLPVVQDESLLHGSPQVLYLLQVTLLRTHLRCLALKPTMGHSSDHVLQRGREEKNRTLGNRVAKYDVFLKSISKSVEIGEMLQLKQPWCSTEQSCSQVASSQYRGS